MNYTKGERKYTQPDGSGGVNVFTDAEHIAYFDSLDDAILDIAAPAMYEVCKSLLEHMTMGKKESGRPYLADVGRMAAKAVAKAEGKDAWLW